MSDGRGRPPLKAPKDLSNVVWCETPTKWHAITVESLRRWERTLCGGRVRDPECAYDAAQFPDGPSMDFRTVCEKCWDRVNRLRNASVEPSSTDSKGGSR